MALSGSMVTQVYLMALPVSTTVLFNGNVSDYEYRVLSNGTPRNYDYTVLMTLPVTLTTL
jgi:hypothetical protein